MLVAGRMKPNPSVAVQFRDPQLPAGLLRCLDVGLPLSAKDPKVPTSRFVKSEVESLIALLHREAPIFRCVAPHQLRRVLTCIAVEFVKITGGGSSPTSVTAAC